MSATDSGSTEEVDGRRGASLQKVFHEELVLQWIVSHPNLRVLILGNAWFFFELLVWEREGGRGGSGREREKERKERRRGRERERESESGGREGRENERRAGKRRD